MGARVMLGVVCAAVVAVVASCKDGRSDPGETEEPGVEQPAPVAAVEQVRSFPHDSLAFTQGLLWLDGQLYESTGRYGQSSLRIVEVETGNVLQRVNLGAQYFAEGLAAIGDSLYQLTWKEGVAFIYDAGTLRQVALVENPALEAVTYESAGMTVTPEMRAFRASWLGSKVGR